MIVDYELFPYLAMISVLIAAGIAVWRGLFTGAFRHRISPLFFC